MEITEVTLVPTPIAIYFDDSNCINQKFNNVNLNKMRSQASELTNKYLPILNILDVRDDRLAFQNQDNYGDKYITESKEYKHKGSQLGCTSSDLIINTPEFLYNLSDTPVTIRGRNNIPKYFLPNVNPVIQKTHQGNLLFFRVFYLNAIDFIHKHCGIENYLKELHEVAVASQNPNQEELIKVTKYVNDFLENSDTDTATISRSTTIKVVTVACVSVDKLKSTKQTNGELCKNFLFINRDIILTLRDYKDIPNHPSFDIKYQISAEIADKYKDGIIKIFIVDKGDKKIGNRYTSLAGRVVKIPSISNTELPNGLYLISANATTNIHDNRFMADNCYVSTLDKINEVKYIYTSEEEALKGADKVKEYTDQLSLDKMDVEKILIRAKVEYTKELDEHKLKTEREYAELKLKTEKDAAEQKRKLDDEAAEQKRKSDEQSHIQKLKYEKEMADLKSYYEKSSYGRKDHYEEKKYERDDTIEKIKTVGAICGLVAGGYVLFKKFG